MTAGPGWYPDPQGSQANKYWDGAAWHDAVPVPEGKRRRPKWLGLVIPLAMFLGVAYVAHMAFGGGSSTPAAGPVSSPPRATVADVPMGSPARDGGVEFVVKSVRRAPSVTRDTYTVTAQGEFFIVDLSVTNVGDQTETYSSSDQMLIVSGKQIGDGVASQALNNNAISRINPGIGIDTAIAYDVPVGTQPDRIELHGDALSPGVYVDLR